MLSPRCLHHATGNYGSRGMQKGCALRELLENADNWLPARPGEAFHYNNLSAGAAGVSVERAANRPFDDIMLVFSRLPSAPAMSRAASPRSVVLATACTLPVPIRKYNAQALS